MVAKIHEELEEVREAAATQSPDRVADEVGDLLFAVANLARHLKVDPEAALRGTNAKFERRFRTIERTLAGRGRSLQDADLDEMERIWIEAKRAEGKPAGSPALHTPPDAPGHVPSGNAPGNGETGA